MKPETVSIRDLDLNLLRALDALLREKSVTRAADRIGIGQSGMSGALARLRIALGDPILVRVSRRYELTPYAAGLSQPVTEILQLIESTFERKSFDPRTDRRTFTIVASDYSEFLVLEPFINQMVVSAPHVHLDIRHGSSSSLRQAELREVDLVLWRPIPYPTLNSEVLVTDRWVCAAWSQNPELQQGLTLERYLTLPHVRHQIEGTETEADHLADSFRPERTIRVRTHTFSSIPFLLRGTPLVTVLPERLGLRFSDAADIKLTDLPFSVPPIGIAMYWNPSLTSNSGHSWLRSALRKAVTERVSGNHWQFF